MMDAVAYTGLVLHEGNDLSRLIKDRDDLIAQGWYKRDQIKVAASAWDEGVATQYALTVKRPDIRSAYCNIPLKIMAEYARKPEVKLMISAKLERRANTILAPEKDLRELEGIIRNYIASNKNSKAKDWIDDKAPLNNEALKAIRNRYFHFSSKPGMGYNPRFVYDFVANKYRRRRFVYDA